MISFLPRRRARVPTIIQQEAVECGAACLAMVLAGHGRWVSLEELRETCGVSRDGTKASDILRAARRHGLVAKGLRKETVDLAALPVPFVVFWNFNHFVVVEQFALGRDGKAKIWLNDPAVGPRQVSLQEFDDAFTGVVLAFEPGPDFTGAGSRRSLVSLLSMQLAGFKIPLLYAMLAGVLLMIPGIVSASFGQIFIDNIVIGGQADWLWPLIGGMVGVALFRGLLVFMQQWSLVRTQTALATSAAAQQMWTVLHLSLGFFSQRFAGDIANRFNLVDRMSGLISGGLAPAAIGIVSIAGYGAALFLLDYVLAAIAVACAAAALVILLLSSRGLEDASRRMVGDELKLGATTIQGIAMADDFKATGTESMYIARWAGFQAKVIDAEQGAVFRSNLLGETSAFVMAAAGVLVLIAGGMRIMDGVMTIGVLMAFQTLMGSFSGPVLSLVGVGGQMQQVRGIAERLDDIAHYHRVVDRVVPADQAAQPLPATIALRLDEVSFTYSPLAPPFVDRLSLDLAPGMRIALVGRSGSGKSTLGKLMVGLLAPSTGVVRLGDTPLDQWPTTQLRKLVAYVDQTIGLIEGTFKENITLWDTTIDEERLVAACHDAQAHEFITARPGGYAARIYEGGNNLSGGERQRLALARALVVEPSILVLDEATSALDPPVEEAIMAAMRRRGCACVIIAHRLSTIRDCDLICVMQNGRIVEAGTHDQLIALRGEYRRLIET